MESDAITYPSTSTNAIIIQLKQKIQNVKKVCGFQEIHLLERLEEAHQAFLKAEKQWRNSQNEIGSQLNILQGRRSEEIYRLEKKILRYRILEKFGFETCRKAFELAKKYQDKPEKLKSEDLEKGETTEIQMARDFLNDKLGTWFSNDMEEWGKILSFD